MIMKIKKLNDIGLIKMPKVASKSIETIKTTLNSRYHKEEILLTLKSKTESFGRCISDRACY